MYITKHIKPDQKAIYCDSNCNIFWNKQNYSESTKMSGYKEKMRRRSTEDFQGNEPIGYI